MQQVKIYIETDSSSPKATEKHYGYVLETTGFASSFNAGGNGLRPGSNP